MIWLCPFVPDGLHPRTEESLRRHVPHVAFVPLDPDDDNAYGVCLKVYWQHPTTYGGLAVCEQDNVLRADIATAFRECPDPWCAGIYPWLTNIGPALGMTRFRSELIAAVPDAVEQAISAAPHWKQVGWQLTERVLPAAGFRAHIHLPPCEHLNPEQALRPEFALMSVEEHLAALGYAVSEDGMTADWIGV